ncbi:MAG: hypothetical protein AVDCRST_MAG93-6118, partial [uncultured Chloroflexia bacterium]
MTTAQDVAQWMADRVNEFYLPHKATALEIREVFGEPFVVQSEGDTWVIAPPV